MYYFIHSRDENVRVKFKYKSPKRILIHKQKLSKVFVWDGNKLLYKVAISNGTFLLAIISTLGFFMVSLSFGEGNKANETASKRKRNQDKKNAK